MKRSLYTVAAIVGLMLLLPAQQQQDIPLVSSGALETNHILKSSPGSLYSVCATIGATSGYLMVFDATSLPANGAVTPKLWLYIPTIAATANTGCISFGGQPVGAFTTGITVGFSTTGPFTLTASNAAFSGSVK